MEPEAAVDAAADNTADPAPTSKRQLKRKAKMERQEETKRARRAADKERKQQVSEAKRAAVGQMLQSMAQEEKQQWLQQQKERKQQLWTAKKATKERQQQALSAPQCVVIDLDFPNLMTPADLKSLCQQISYSYSAAVNRDRQIHLHLLGATADLEAALHRQLPGHVHWAATKSDKNFKEYFKDRLQDLVYLTADSPNELTDLDCSKIYIIGGIVDRNKHKGICYRRAQNAGIATARLPIRKFIKLQTSAVITVNQVVDILVRVQEDNDWKAALQELLPGRKIVEQADAAPAAKHQTAPTAGQGVRTEPATQAATAEAKTCAPVVGATGVAEAAEQPFQQTALQRGSDAEPDGADGVATTAAC